MEITKEEFYIDLIQYEALLSPDPSTKIGALIVRDDNILGSGHNDFPKGVEVTPERLERPHKYFYFEHAERMAIANANENETDLRGSEMYVSSYPCADCARSLITAGITKLHCYEPDFSHPQWGSHWKAAQEMLSEAEVEIKYIK